MAAQILRQMGSLQKAAESAERAFALSPHSDLFRLNAMSFDDRPARANRRKADADPGGDPRKQPATADYGHALLHAWRGDAEKCLVHLGRCVDECAPFSLFINADPNLDHVRRHQEFPGIAARLQRDYCAAEADPPQLGEDR